MREQERSPIGGYPELVIIRPLLMNKLRTIILITGILVAGLAFNATAQKRPDKTASARAYYGHKPEKYKPKVRIKKNRKQKFALRKQARKTTRAYASDRNKQKRRT
jgi:hypothetical protein